MIVIERSESNDKADQPLLLNVDELARFLSISRRSVWRMVSAQELPSPIRLGRATRWRRLEIEEFVEGLGTK